MSSTSVLGTFTPQGSGGTLHDQAYQKIKEQIVSGEMAPASLIDENELIRELKLGLTPIRQALRRLALENLVIIVPRSGTIVADVNVRDLEKIYEIRIQLVPQAYLLAAKRAKLSQLAEIETHLDESAALIENGTAADLLRIDRRAQGLVIAASENSFLIEILERLHAQAMRYWRMDHILDADLRRQVRQHRDILAALEARNGRRAAKFIREIIADFHRRQIAGI